MERLLKQRRTSRRLLVDHPRGLPLAIFLAVAAITGLASYSIERGQRQSEAAQMRERAGAIASALERRANANASYLRAGAALFATLGIVPPDRFRRFVSELRLDADFRGAEGIGWALRVDPGQTAMFDRLVSTAYGPDVKLRPAIAADQPYAVPVTYFEPDNDVNRRALGFDMFSEPIRRAAMIEAEHTARPTASGKVRLLMRDRRMSAGFLIYMPVFGSGAQSSRLEGYVYSVFNAQTFLASALELESAGDLGISIYDQAAEPDRLLAREGPDFADGTTVRETITIANHPWVLEVSGRRLHFLSPLSIATLLFGLALSVLLTSLVMLLTRQAQEDSRRLAWLEEQTAIRDTLTRELNHRVKNTLANVLSIVSLSRRRAGSLDEFADSLAGRIRALSATHDLLVKSEWGVTPVKAVIEAELAPYARDAGASIELAGADDVELAPKDALSLGLAIHELATNAAKYGSLSVPSGTLTVSWFVEDGNQVRIEWIESGGPPVPAERGRGFGLDLIEKIVAHELRQPVKLVFDPAGVRCTLIVPLRRPSEFAMRAARD